jgi:hypothetical protein
VSSSAGVLVHFTIDNSPISSNEYFCSLSIFRFLFTEDFFCPIFSRPFPCRKLGCVVSIEAPPQTSPILSNFIRHERISCSDNNFFSFSRQKKNVGENEEQFSGRRRKYRWLGWAEGGEDSRTGTGVQTLCLTSN